MSAQYGEPGNEGLIFRWRKSVLPRWRLAFFMVVAGVVHLGFFYLFRVIYPEPVKTIPSPNRMTLLSSADPSAKAVLDQIADRRSAYFPGNSKSVDLADFAARFVPSFRDYSLGLRIPEDTRQKLVLPPVSVPGELVFPPLAVAAPNSAASRPDMNVKLNIVSGLEGREVAHVPNWDVEQIAAFPERRFQFSVGFDSLGRVVYVLPLQSPGNPESKETISFLSNALKTMRLSPGDDSVSGTVEVQW